MPVKTGIVGYGGAARRYHIPNLERIPEAQLVAVADVNEEILESIVEADVFTDYRDMFDNVTLDSIHLCTPPSLRVPVVEAAAHSGVSVLIEKPTAFSTDEVDRMIEIRDNFGIEVSCVQNLRFEPEMQFALKMVEDGFIGDVTAIANTFSIQKDLSGVKQNQPWAGDLPGGPIGEGAPHLFYTTLSFAGKLEGDISATTRRFLGEEMYDALSISCTDRMKRIISMTYLTQSHGYRRLTVHGTNGNLTVDFLSNTVEIINSKKTSVHKFKQKTIDRFKEAFLNFEISSLFPAQRTEYQDYQGPSFGHYCIIRQHVDAVLDDGEVPVPLEADRDVVSLLECLGDQ